MPPASTLYPIGFASGGVRGDVHPFLLGGEGFQRATNVRLHRRMARTAHGWESVPVTAENAGDFAEWVQGNTQGAWYFNPGMGQSAVRFADEQAQVLHSVAGKLFRLRPTMLDGRYCMSLTDASGDLRSNRFVQMAWGAAGESWFVRTDSVGKTLFLDGRNGKTRWSLGYNTVRKDESELPHKAGPVCYLHGRMHVAVRMNGMNGIIVGDPVHRTSFTGPDNILAATEQVYLNTGLFLAPPSSMGAVLSISILPLQDTQHGHGEMVAFCPNPGGTWTADTNIWPRSEWGNRVISKHAILNSAAAGPYALCHMDGDIAFRSAKGIQTLRSARAERNSPGSAYRDLAGPVRWAMSGDYEQLLSFASMARHERSQRIFCTVRNFSRGLNRWHRGFVVACQDPEQGVNDNGFTLGAWEGLRCLPNEAGGPVQFVTGIFDGREELFAICWNQRKRRHSIWRMRTDREYDTLLSGKRQPIDSRIVTGQFGGSMFQAPKGAHLWLLAEDVVGPLTWQVLWRNPDGRWRPVYGRHETDPADGPRYVGPFPQDTPAGLRIEFMVRWRGAASIMLMFEAKPADSMATNIKAPQACGDEGMDAEDDDYEYNNGIDWAEPLISKCQTP